MELLLQFLIAVVPVISLLTIIYQKDQVEKESKKLLFILVLEGALSAVLACISELALTELLSTAAVDYQLSEFTVNVIDNFLIVALSEEFFKYILMKRKSWKSKEFNCYFDGIVYATYTSLGFALLENILYVNNYGIDTGIARAFTAIPGHTCFGIIMGTFYTRAKYIQQTKGKYSFFNFFLAILIPVLMHGTYDLLLNISGISFFTALGYMLVMNIISFSVLHFVSKNDGYFNNIK